MSMRNDANDDFDDVPSLRADTFDDDDIPPSARTSVHSRTPPVVKVKAASTGPLWALVGALFFAFIGLAWWSFQQISLMEQQLVATQESFARISEEAAGPAGHFRQGGGQPEQRQQRQRSLEAADQTAGNPVAGSKQAAARRGRSGQ
jgi:hypothetical protein